MGAGGSGRGRGGLGKGPQPSRFEVAVTATGALRGVWPERASRAMPPKGSGRERNRVKFSKWGFYFKGDGQGNAAVMKKLRTAATNTKARVPGGPTQSLTLEKVSKNKVEVAWPNAVSYDTCARLLKIALDDNWKNFVTEPAGVQGTQQEGATAEEAPAGASQEAPAGAPGEASLEADLEEALAADPPSMREPFSPRAAGGASSSGAMASGAATAEARTGANLLSMKLEAVIELYSSSTRT